MSEKYMEWQYGPATIRMVRESKRFSVFWESETSAAKIADSYAEATEYVDSREKRERATNKVKISVPVITYDRWKGIGRHTITGIHGGHGGYTASPALDKYSDAYLDHPYVAELLEKVIALRQVLREAEEKPKEFLLPRAGYRGGHTAEEVQGWRDKMVVLADAAQKAAQ